MKSALSITSEPAATPFGKQAGLSRQDELTVLQCLVSTEILVARQLGVGVSPSVALLGKAVGKTRTWRGRIALNPLVYGFVVRSKTRGEDGCMRQVFRNLAEDFGTEAQRLLSTVPNLEARLAERGGLSTVLTDLGPAFEKVNVSPTRMQSLARYAQKLYNAE